MVDRQNLDIVRAEQELQYQGEVSEATMISLGKLTGAQTVIDCSISGSGDLRRLRIKALNVETAEIQFQLSYNIR
jgi:hypothetical protein